MDLNTPSNWDAPEHEGWLSKQGHVVKNWKNRYFRLKGNRCFYFENHGARKAKGVIALEEHSKIDVGEVDGRKYCFVVSLPSDKKKHFILDAPSPQVRDEWIEAFRLAMAANRANKMSVGSASKPEILRSSNAELSMAVAAAAAAENNASSGESLTPRRVRLVSQPTAVVPGTTAPSAGTEETTAWQSAAPRHNSVSSKSAPAAAPAAAPSTQGTQPPKATNMLDSIEAKILAVFLAMLVIRILWAFAMR